MISLFWSGLLTVLLLSGCGWNGTPTGHNDFVPLTSIEVTAISSTIAAKTSTKLSVIGHYSNLFTRDITDQATWSSASPTVANFITTTSKNRVTAGLAAGTALLTATVGSVSATYTLTVSAATIKTMTVTPASPSVASGLTTQFAVNGTFSDNTTQDLTFDATWTATPIPITSPVAASVSNDPASKGLAKGLAVGTATITATFDSIPGSTTLIVTVPLLQSITVTPANSSVAGFSKTVNFIATGTYSDGTTAVVTTTATWVSSQTIIATITTGGVATTVAAGTTSISATVGGISGNTNLTVTPLVLITNGLTIAPVSPIFVRFGVPQQLTVTATFTDNSTQDVTTSSLWTSTVSTIASVNTTGLVTGVTAGTATITASYGGQSVLATVTVQ